MMLSVVRPFDRSFQVPPPTLLRVAVGSQGSAFLREQSLFPQFRRLAHSDLNRFPARIQSQRFDPPALPKTQQLMKQRL